MRAAERRARKRPRRSAADVEEPEDVRATDQRVQGVPRCSIQTRPAHGGVAGERRRRRLVGDKVGGPPKSALSGEACLRESPKTKEKCPRPSHGQTAEAAPKLRVARDRDHAPSVLAEVLRDVELGGEPALAEAEIQAHGGDQELVVPAGQVDARAVDGVLGGSQRTWGSCPGLEPRHPLQQEEQLLQSTRMSEFRVEADDEVDSPAGNLSPAAGAGPSWARRSTQQNCGLAVATPPSPHHEDEEFSRDAGRCRVQGCCPSTVDFRNLIVFFGPRLWHIEIRHRVKQNIHN